MREIDTARYGDSLGPIPEMTRREAEAEREYDRKGWTNPNPPQTSVDPWENAEIDDRPPFD